MHRLPFAAFLLALLALRCLADEPVAIGSRRELFVDRLLIDRMSGAELQLQSPQPAGVALKFEEPWEGSFSGYVTVLRDEPAAKYRMYYRGSLGGPPDVEDSACTCYAESADGIHWIKPKLGFHEVGGTKGNNVMLAHIGPYTHNFAPFLDERPGIPPEERFKALAGLGGKSGGLCVFASGDGLHWRKLQEEPVLTKGAFDSQNVGFWSAAEQCYVAYFRIFTGGGTDEKTWQPKGVRWVSRATSADLIHWNTPTPMKCDQPLIDHIYVNQTHPYFRAPQIYISTAARFMQGKAVLDPSARRELAPEAKAYPALVQDCSEAVLMSSRAGMARFDRTFMEGWVRPGSGFRNWTSRANYPACGIVATGPAEMSIYVGRQYGQHSAWLQRMTLRTDGFASLHAGYDSGEMITKPLTFSGERLRLNVSTGAAGSVSVEICDAGGAVVPGFGFDDCLPITGDDVDRIVTWSGSGDLSKLAGQPVRLRFVLKDADVFSFAFGPG